jgi:hypothetical protein
MQSMIDILGAMMIGSILLLMAMSSLDAGLQRFVNHNADAIVQNELAGLSEIIQEDLRKMGYGIPEAESGDIIQIAQANRLKFLSRVNSDAVADTIEYLISALDTITFIDTSIVLYGITRTVTIASGSTNSGHVGTISIPTIFRYLNQVGVEVVLITATRMVEVTLVSLNPNIYLSDEVFIASSPAERMVELRKLLRESYWRQTRVISKNLRR